jgi:NifU-like protein involved in Fe-S cluster formation
MDHFNAPRNAGQLADADAVGRADLNGNAPRITFFLTVREERVAGASFLAFGCGATIACCSMLTEMIKARSLADCATIRPSELVDALDGLPSGKVFCADLAIAALTNALKTWLEKSVPIQATNDADG